MCLVGEQSNAYRILLRYDRKSRHRRIKKQRRYERLAATSQFRGTDRPIELGRPGRFSVLRRVRGRTLSGERSPYLRRALPSADGGRRAHTFASVEPPSLSPVGCGSSLSFGLLPVRPGADSAGRGYRPELGTEGLARFPRIQVCRPTGSTPSDQAEVGPRAWD